VARTNERAGLPTWLLVAAPLVALVAVVLLWMGIDVIGEIGPLDKAKLGWLVAVPLTILVPVLAAWAGGRLGRSGRPILAAVVGLGAGLAVGWPVWIAYATQCAAVGLPIPISPIATTAAIVGLTMATAVLASGFALGGGRSGLARIALACGAAAACYVGGFIVYVLMSPSLLFGQCVVRPGITP
jgi:hypothetical protein